MEFVTKFVVRIVVATLFLAVSPTVAQTAYPPIRPENAAQVVQIARYGNGVVREMAFSQERSNLAVATTLGVWVVAVPVGAQGLAPLLPQAMTLLEGQGGAESVAFSPDGSMIAAGGDDNSVMVWDTASGEIVTRLEGHIYPVSAVAWAGNYLASGDWSGVVRVWDTQTWSEYRVLTTTGKIERLDFDEALLNLTASMGTKGCEIWSIASAEKLGCAFLELSLDTMIFASREERFARYLPDSAQIQIEWEDEVVAMLDGFFGELDSVFFSPDGRVGAKLITSTYLIWKGNGTRDDDFPVPVLSPDGTRIATFGNDGVIRLSDAATGEPIAPLHGHIRAVTGVAFSPDGRLLASSSNDGTIQLWDATVTQDSGSLATLTGHNGGVTSVAFNADGTLLASAGYDGTVRLWGIKP